ncbi:MAG TPA: hypothetical protein DCZ43_13015 [candidate division Zixibacteria bacterium]|jgi:uncharacterized ferredoxin-like protein|nr:hypothetical protein [candidate division Zixibacteria bacterium]
MNSDLSGAVLQVAAMMELAARTAPKTRGEDFIKTMIVSGDRLRELSENMVKFGAARKKGGFDRDGSNVAASSAVLLVGLKDAKAAGLNCGACGYPNCEALKAVPAVDIEFKGPICVYRHIDLGIALGSAAKTAQIFNVDNRIMYRVGAAARWMKLVDWDYVLGIPLAATGKSPFFDR